MMTVDPAAAVREARSSSEILACMKQEGALRERCVDLTADQIAELESRGSTCADWSRVRAAPGFEPRHVGRSHFAGDVCLGVLGPPVELSRELPGGVSLASGVHNATLVDSSSDASLVARSFIGAGAAVLHVGEVAGKEGSAFACGEELTVGVETGGREVAIYPEITVPVAARIALDRADDSLQRDFVREVRDYAASLSSGRTMVAPGARVFHTPVVRGAYVGPRALVDGVEFIDEAAIMSSEEEPTRVAAGAILLRSIVQWGAVVETGAVLEQAVALEHSKVTSGGSVQASIIGPGTGIEKSEVVHSLVGPLVGMHHQSLLIGAVWPEGRGHIGGGARRGANHTGRAPDQEILPGEGTFFGLGAMIKFPADFSRAPYLFVPTAVAMSPQRIEFPFSLVREAHVSLRRAMVSGRPLTNEILPGWALTDSPYTIVRAGRKYADRYSARRARIDPDPLRGEILLLIREARDRLRGLPSKDSHTPDDVPGLGANVMTEASRLRAIAGYTFTLVHRALLGLWARLKGCGKIEEALAACGRGDAGSGWSVHRSILLAERPEVPVRSLLGELVEMQHAFAKAVEDSKAKDDARGSRVAERYTETHTAASLDPHVARTWEETSELERDVTAWLDGIDGDGPSIGPA